MSQMNTHTGTVFTVTDPRTFDGNPYEVAARTVAQLEAILTVAESAIPSSRLMIRNAELERQMALGDEPDALAWEDGPQSKIINEMSADLSRLRMRLRRLKQAAEFDPKHPVRT
jgi:hypothetical protein